MKKIVRSLTLMCLVFLLSANISYAHTYLHDSNPADGETVTEQLSDIVLNFETRIEPLSTFELVQNDDTTVPVQISVEDDKLIGTLAEPLASGEYTVNWDIIGEDGHQITGDFSFTVDVEEVAVPEDQQGSEENVVEDEEATPGQEDVEGNESTDEGIEEPVAEENETDSGWSTSDTIFLGLFIVVVGGLLLMMRGKRK